MAWKMKPNGACRILLIRHCETEGNLLHVFQGQNDTPVSARGQEQLTLLALRCRNIPIDVIYTSPLGRAVKTAEAVNTYHHVHIKPHAGLLEIHGGIWEGNPIEPFCRGPPGGRTRLERASLGIFSGRRGIHAGSLRPRLESGAGNCGGGTRTQRVYRISRMRNPEYSLPGVGQTNRSVERCGLGHQHGNLRD